MNATLGCFGSYEQIFHDALPVEIVRLMVQAGFIMKIMLLEVCQNLLLSSC